jgi:hypothetical protein
MGFEIDGNEYYNRTWNYEIRFMFEQSDLNNLQPATPHSAGQACNLQL